jgi:tetratricopeptide (TPR) repeat protein
VDKRTARLAVLLVVVALGVGGWYGWSWWNGRSAADAAAAEPAAAGAEGGAEASSASGAGAAAGSAAAMPSAGDAAASRELKPSDVPGLLQRADQLAAAERYEEALSVLEAAREADPTSFDVVDRLERVRVLARERQEALERIAMGRDLFRGGSYREALRLFYRIPADYRPPQLDRWIADGWYNLGVQALQAGSLVEARRFFQDCLELRPGDSSAQRHQELVRRYRGRGLDQIYWAYVNRLQPRALADD